MGREAPLFVKVDITGNCNLNCKMCFRELMGFDKHRMTFEQFKKIIDKNDINVLMPYGWAEATVHPEFIKFMKYAHEKGIKLAIVTNGTLWTEKLSREFLKLKPLHITFSIDSADPEEYERYRPPAKFHKVINNLKRLIKLRDEISPNTRIQIHSVIDIHRFFNNTMEKLIKISEDLGVDELQLSDIDYNVNYGYSKPENSVMYNLTKKEIDKRLEKLKSDKILLNLTFYQQPYRRCHRPHTFCYIAPNGDMYPCCQNCPGTKIGNVFKKSIKELYNSEEMNKFREKSKTGENKICANCTMWAKGNYYPFLTLTKNKLTRLIK